MSARRSILVVLGLFAFAAPATGPCQDGAMFRGNLAHTGEYPGPAVDRLPAIKWRFHTHGRVISSAAVDDGTVYVGSTDGHLYAIDAATGRSRWKFRTDARVTSSPAVHAGMVYFSSYDGFVYAVNAPTGHLRWKFQTGGERRYAGKHLHGLLPAAEAMPDPYDVYLSSPAVWHGLVYIGSGDGNVYALDARTGSVTWKFATGNVVHASPAVAEGTVFIGSWDTYFYALDALTGRERWRFKTGDDTVIHNQVGIQSSAAVADGVVYFGCRDSQLYALDAHTGKQRWKFDNHGSWVVGSPAVHDGKVYFGTSDSGLLYALDAASGAPVFSQKLVWFVFASPAIAGNLLYAATWDGRLTAMDLTQHTPAWTFATDGSRHTRPAFMKADSTINGEALGSENFYDDVFVQIDRMFAMGSLLSSPVVADGVLYVGSTDGDLYALH